MSAETNGGGNRPRVLFVGRTRYRLPLPDWLAKKWEALERQLDYRVIASPVAEDMPLELGRFRLLTPGRPRALDGLLFYVRCVLVVRREIRAFAPDVIVAESPYTGAASLIARALAGRRGPRIVVEIHGDWRTATRLYGSPSRRALSPLADSVSRFAVRRGDTVRAVSPYTGRLAESVRGISVTATFPTYTDLSVFAGRPPVPLPERPTAVFVGMLEYYKNIDGLAAAWRRVARRLPEARLVIVGNGARREIVEALVAELPEQVEWFEELPPQRVAEELDRATIFALPSRSEGLPRVLIEAFARGRGAVGARAGGIPELVEDGVTGLLVDPEDVEGIAAALVTALTDRERAEAFGRTAHERYRTVHTTAGEYAARVRDLIDISLRGGPSPGERPRVLVVGSAEVHDEAAVAALRDELDLTVLAPRASHAGALWHLTLPFRVRARVRKARPHVVVAGSPYIGALTLVGLAFRRRDRPSLVIEVHADWRTVMRSRGSRIRLLFAPFADWAARYAMRRADAVRAASPYTASLVEDASAAPPVVAFPAYVDMTPFTAPPVVPLPETPTAVFVGVFERSKDLGTLARAWRLVAARVPDARLVFVGKGPLLDVVERVREDFPDRVENAGYLSPPEVAQRLDDSTFLVLPSRSEGFGLVILEAFARGRAVVGTRVGGIPHLVEDGVTGLLVSPGEPEELADAMIALLSDRAQAERLGAAALDASRRLQTTPDDYAARVRTLVDRTLAASSG